MGDGYNAAYYGWLAKLYHGVGLPLAEAACLQRGLDPAPAGGGSCCGDPVPFGHPFLHNVETHN